MWFRYYELALSLLQKTTKLGYRRKYNANMLAAAAAKHDGFKYGSRPTGGWKQKDSLTERGFIYTTTSFLTVEMLDKIHDEMKNLESSTICCKSFSNPVMVNIPT